MSSVSSSTSSPLLTSFPAGSSTKPAATNSSSSGTDSSQLQNAQEAINEVGQIPGQLKQQAHNWAAQELTHLLSVLRVTMETDPSSGESLKQLAQGISSDAKQIAGQNGNSSVADPFTPPVASGQSGDAAQVDISFSFSETSSDITAQGGDSSSIDNVYFQSQSESVDLQVEVSSVDGAVQTSPETYSHDVTLLSQASIAIGQINTTLQKVLQNPQTGDQTQAVNQAGNDIADSLNGLISDAVNALIASPSASLTASIPGALDQTA